MLNTLTEQLRRREHLSDGQVQAAISQLASEVVAPEMKAEFLTALALKGESTEEIAAFARNLRELSVQPPLDAETRAREILDVCGTGGDRLNTFNISTTVAIVCAAAGVTVAKHGNRAITSQAGSADVLEALGIRIDLTPEEAARSLREQHFAFFFAQKYHPAFKHIGPARKLCAERGQRTIFNFLGPLLNPARPSAQLVGVPRPQLCEPMARVLQSLGVRRGMVVSGRVSKVESPRSKVQGPRSKVQGPGSKVQGPGSKVQGPGSKVQGPGSKVQGTGSRVQGTEAHLDEFSTLGLNTVAEFYQDRGFATSSLSPENFPLQVATLADLAGGDRETNAGIVRRVLGGVERGPRRDAVLLNAAAALFVAGKAGSMTEGWELAAHVIDSGEAAKKLKALAG